MSVAEVESRVAVASGTAPKVTQGIVAAQAWLQDVWEGCREAGRPDLAARAFDLICDLERLAADVGKSR